MLDINVREYRRENGKWTIQRNWQYRIHTNKTKTTTQYIVETTMRKQTHNVNKSCAPIKQLGIKTNRTSFLCGNRNEHHKTELGT